MNGGNADAMHSWTFFPRTPGKRSLPYPDSRCVLTSVRYLEHPIQRGGGFQREMIDVGWYV